MKYLPVWIAGGLCSALLVGFGLIPLTSPPHSVEPEADPIGAPGSRSVAGYLAEAGHRDAPSASIREDVFRNEAKADVHLVLDLSKDAEYRAGQWLSADIQGLYAAWERRCLEPGSGPDGEKTLSDAIAEMEALVPIRKYEVARELLLDQDYRVFPSGSEDTEGSPIPAGCSPLRIYNFPRSSGEAVDIVFFVPMSHERLTHITDELKLMRHSRREAAVVAFDQLPEDQRMEKISRHRSALDEILALRRDLTMPAEERQARFVELSKDLLPAGWLVAGNQR